MDPHYIHLRRSIDNPLHLGSLFFAHISIVNFLNLIMLSVCLHECHALHDTLILSCSIAPLRESSAKTKGNQMG